MAEIYALMQSDKPTLFAQRKAGVWRIGEARPDIGLRGKNLCVFVTGTEVSGLETMIPARSEGEARRSAPFAIEDDIGETVETVHVALGPRSDDHSHPRRVNVTAVSQMDRWIAQMSAEGLGDADLVAAHSILPDGNRLFSAGNLVLGRLGSRSFALEANIGADVFLGLIDTHEDIAVFGEALATSMRLHSAGPGAENDADLLAQLATWASETNPIDLRQGAYLSRQPVDMAGLKQWRVAGVLAGLVAATWFGSILLQTQALKAQRIELDSRSVEFVEAGWPEANGDPQSALASLRKDRGGAVSVFPSALTAIAILYDGIQAVAGSELRSVRYDRRRGQVSAVVAFDGFAGADALTRAMEPSGLSVRAGDARQSGDKVVGEVMLEVKP